MFDTKKSICCGILFCIFLSGMFEIVEASKAKKVAKEVVKKAVEKKLHKSHSKRWFPVWLIVLLVLGSTSLIGLGIFLWCFFKRSSRSQTCFV